MSESIVEHSVTERHPSMAFDWHGGDIHDATLITPHYRSTQNVRRYFKERCGEQFRFDRDFMAWMKTAEGKTMGDAVKEWRRRHIAP
jgi:hypothetical protein